MSARVRHQCKKCSARVNKNHALEYQCVSCGAVYKLLTTKTGVALDLVIEKKEPLNLPKGSVRALVTLSLAGSFVYQVLAGQRVEDHLLQLFLTTVFYYFAFRKRDKSITIGGRVITAEVDEPLYLPQGSIRNTLLACVLVGLLSTHDALSTLPPALIYFYSVFFALYVGYMTSKFLNESTDTLTLKVFNDLKALITIASAGVLVAQAVLPFHFIDPLLPSTVISFYFGSRH